LIKKYNCSAAHPSKTYQRTTLDEPEVGRKQNVFKECCPLRPAQLEHRHKYKPRAFSVWHAADLSNEAKNFRLSCEKNLDIAIFFIQVKDLVQSVPVG